MVGVENPRHRALHRRSLWVEEGDGVALSIGHHDRLIVRCQVQVMGLFTYRDALGFRVRQRVNHADVRVERVQYKNWRGGPHTCGN